MGFSLIRHLESVQANVKLFYLDSAADLPVIDDKQSIKPGSEAWEVSTGNMWVLNSEYAWLPFTKPGSGGGGGPAFDDVPAVPIGKKYQREATGNPKGRWVIADTSNTTVENFAPNRTYAARTLIANESKLYRAKIDFTAGPAFVEADWEPFTSNSSATIVDFTPGTKYTKNEVIQYKDRIYRAKADFVAGLVIDPNDWEEVSKSVTGMTLAEWNAIPIADRAEYTVITDSPFDYKI